MAVVCAACQTENRDGAKFCKGCGRRLAAATAASADDVWPETQRMPLHAVSDPMMASDESTIITGVAPAVQASSQRQPRRISDKKSKSKRVVFSVLGVLVVAAVVGAANWRANDNGRNMPVAQQKLPDSPANAPAPFAAPSGAAPVPSPSPSATGPVARGPVAIESPPAQPATEAPPSSAPAQPPSPSVAQTASGRPIESTAPPRQTAQRAAVAPTPAQAVKPKKTDQPRKNVVAEEATARKPRKAAPAATTTAPSAPVAVPQTAPGTLAAATPAPVAEAPPLPSPSAVCAGQGFFARGRCMVAQCAKAEYRTHAQCDVVRRQEQLEEEKRNPTQLN